MIFYFSGTGNTRWVARQLAKHTNDNLYFIPEEMEHAPHTYTLKDNEPIAFVFPVYAWGPPKIVMQFIEQLNVANSKNAYTYAACTCGDDMGRTRQILAKELKKKGWELNALFYLNMPDCYISLPGFDVDKPEERTHKLEQAPRIVAHMAEVVKQRPQRHYEEKPGPLPRIKSYVLRPLFNRFLMSDRPFHATGDCIGCSKCSKVCPVHNITMCAQKPQWNGNCTGCLACYHNCPTKAVQYGKRTKGKGQYLHDNYVNTNE